MIGTQIKTALVSTNSIVQGESVATMWKSLFDNYHLEILFAHRTFRWDSEAHIKAHVHCVIIAFCLFNSKEIKYIYNGDCKVVANNINGYLLDAPNIFIESRGKSLVKGLPEMTKGSQPTDGGHLFLTSEEKDDIISTYPEASCFIKPFVGATEFINSKPRYCLWLKGVSPSVYRNIKVITDRLKAVSEMRANSPTASVRKDAQTPMLFTQIRQPEKEYIIIPRHSSENRQYIPIGFMSPDVICGDANYMIPDASLFIFGVLESNIHMEWMRVVAGRLEMRYRYSPAIYNNFPWPTPTEAQRTKIEKTAQAILDARNLYPDCSLADLYDETTMPVELRRAHQENDKAVMEAYGFNWKNMNEADIVAALFKLYQELTQK